MTAITDLAYVRYQAPDLDAMEAFLTDFGLRRALRTDTTLYMRTHGPAQFAHVTELGATPRTIGIGMQAPSEAGLVEIARRVGAAVEDSLRKVGKMRIMGGISARRAVHRCPIAEVLWTPHMATTIFQPRLERSDKAYQ